MSFEFPDFSLIFPDFFPDPKFILVISQRATMILKPAGTGRPGSQKPVAPPRFSWPNVFFFSFNKS